MDRFCTRAVGLSIGTTGLAWLLSRTLISELRVPLPTQLTLDVVIVRASTAALLVCLAWGWLAVHAAIADVVRRPSTPQAGAGAGMAPAWIRRLVLLACGMGMAASASPALATTTGDVGLDPATQVATLIQGLPLPDRAMDAAPARSAAPPAAPPAAASAAAPPARATSPSATPRHDSTTTPQPASSPTTSQTTHSPAGSDRYSVRHGDSLWAITVDLLGTTEASSVTSGWHALYAANRDLIGGDPSLILPGMELEIPAALR